MKRSILAGLLLISFAGTALWAQDTPNTKHDLGCRTCHSVHNPKGKHLWPTQPKTATKAGTPFIGPDAMCYGCHNTAGKDSHFFEPGRSHPTNVVPSEKVKIPENMPLTFVKGIGKLMTCTTCHDSHNRKPKFLRVPMKNDAHCLACHRMR